MKFSDVVPHHLEYSLQAHIAQLYGLPIEAVPLEMFAFFKVVANGARKYDMNNWLLPDGKRSSEKEMHDSMFHHLAESFALGQQYKGQDASNIKDKESELDPLLHLACRALMLYTRRRRGIIHESDKVS